MKMSTRRLFRKTTSIILVLCVFCLMIPVGSFAEETTFQGIYTEGTTNTNTHAKAKVKVFTMNSGGIPNMYGDSDEISQQGI